MNNHWNKMDADDDRRLFDLLADDELDDARRQELLASLDEQPGGWRNCALAFLEAQSWRRGLRETLRANDSTGRSAARPAPASESPTRLKVWRPGRERLNLALAMAASFLAAFGLSLFLRGGWSWNGAAADPNAVEMAGGPDGGSAQGEKGVKSANGAQGDNTLDNRMGSVTFASDGPAGEHRVQVPYMAVDRYDPALLTGQPDAVPEELIYELKRTGHRIRQSRQLVPIDLQDGRRLVLPVDQMDVHYVGNPYQ